MHVDTDQTEKRLRQKLTQPNIEETIARELGYAFRHAEIPMLATSILSDLLAANRRLCELLGYSEDELKERGLENLIHPEDWEKCLNWGAQAVDEHRDTFHEEIRYQNREGRWLHFMLTSRTMRDSEDDALWFFSQMVDITALKDAQRALASYNQQLEKANEQLARQDQLKNQFLAATSHDLRNPLTTIHGFAELLARSDYPCSDAERIEYAQTISKNTMRLDKMLEDLLTMSKLQSGQMQAYPNQVGLKTHVQAVVENLHLKQKVQVEIEDKLCMRVDPYHLDRMLENYLLNAIKYAPGTELMVRSYQEGNFVHLEVCDRGPGIDAEFVSQLFERFTQAAQTQGSGLGLAIVTGLAVQNNGEAYYRPRKNGGSTFGIKLPSC